MYANSTPTLLDDVLITGELERRPRRLPDHAAENRTMTELAAQLAMDPHGVPQKLAELVAELCGADSAGIGLLETEDGHEVFRWRAAAGLFAPYLNRSIAREASPCAVVIEGHEPMLLREAGRFFPFMQDFEPRMFENMLAPWSVNGSATGTVWVISHDPDRHFDAEDARVLRNLSAFAGAAYQSILSLEETEATRRTLADAEEERTRELRAHNRELKQEVDQRRLTEAELRASEERFRTLADTAPALIWQNDEQGRNMFINRCYADFTGKSAAEILGTGWHAVLHPDDAAGYIDGYLDAIRARGPYRNQVRLRRHDGQWRWFDTYGHPLFDPSGHYAGHVGVALDTTDTVQAEEALKDASRRKDEFLATLAHELRNPLAPISNAVQLLRRPDGRRKADRLIEMMGRQVNQIVRLVDDLMEISRITRGRIDLDKRPVAVAQIVADAVETSRPVIEQGGHELTVSLPGEPLMLDADSVRLTQVLANLLNNAARYTDPGGAIELAVRAEAGQAVISVRDNGIGIPAGQLGKVFEMFAQAHLDAGRGNGGLGIGLAMVRELVQMHGGTVEATSEGPGRGSEFIVRLPLAEQASPDESQQEPVPGLPLSGRRILVVDDNRDAADSLAMLLELDGAEARTVYEGRAALDLLDEFAPQVLLLDLGMPGMDGYEVAGRIRQDPRFTGLRIVALTGWGQESDRERTRTGGFDLHLTKPVDLGVLLGWLAGA